MNSTNSTITLDTMVMVPCDEPKCSEYGTGHNIYEYYQRTGESGIIHTRAMHDYGIRVTRPAWESTWVVENNPDGEDVTADEARRFAAILTSAALECDELNK